MTPCSRCRGQCPTRNMQLDMPHQNSTSDPYPDELIMLVLDRFLYYTGATTILHQLDLLNPFRAVAEAASASVGVTIKLPTPKPSSCSIRDAPKVTNCSSNMSLGLGRCTASKSKISVCPENKSKSICVESKPKATPAKDAASLRTARVDFAHPVAQTPARPPLMSQVRRSLSACPMACRRLKAKLSESCQGKNGCVWTRLVSAQNGYKMYEVYQSCGTAKTPWTMPGNQQPIVVFLVLPNGRVMLFEMC